jgi:hypothetical protein
VTAKQQENAFVVYPMHVKKVVQIPPAVAAIQSSGKKKPGPYGPGFF